MGQPAASIVVRLVTAADLAGLSAHAGIEPANAAAHFEQMARGDYYYVAAFDESGPLGTAVLKTREGDLKPELSNMYVFPAARRRGAGRALSNWIEDQARKLGFDEIFLAVDPDNEAAIPLYISLGYSPTGTHRPKSVSGEGANATKTLTLHEAIYRKSLRYAV